MTHMRHFVSIGTADEYLAGTDSNIFLRMTGTEGTSREFRLNPLISGDAFERGDTNRVHLETTDVGYVYKIDVRSDTRYSGSDWRLDTILVESGEFSWPTPSGVFASGYPVLSARFAFGEWIDDTATRSRTMIGYGLRQLGEPRSYRVVVDTATITNNFYGSTEFESQETTTNTTRSRLETEILAFESRGSSQSTNISVGQEAGASVPVRGASLAAKRTASLTHEAGTELERRRQETKQAQAEHEWKNVVHEVKNVPVGVVRLALHQATYQCGLTSFTDGIGEQQLVSIAGSVGSDSVERWDFPSGKSRKVPLADYQRFRERYLGSEVKETPKDRKAALRSFEQLAVEEKWINGLEKNLFKG